MLEYQTAARQQAQTNRIRNPSQDLSMPTSTRLPADHVVHSVNSRTLPPVMRATQAQQRTRSKLAAIRRELSIASATSSRGHTPESSRSATEDHVDTEARLLEEDQAMVKREYAAYLAEPLAFWEEPDDSMTPMKPRNILEYWQVSVHQFMPASPF